MDDLLTIRWEKYKERFAKLIKLQTDFAHDTKWPTYLTKALDLFTEVFTGDVVYTYHEVTLDKITLLLGGPIGYLSRRSGRDVVSRDEGYIGKTLKLSDELFKIYSHVNKEDGYLCANESTKSELVIKIFDADQSDVVAVLNLESSKEADFNFLDGIVFSLIAAWQKVSMTEDDSERQRIAILQKFSDIFQRVGELSKDESLISSYADLLKYLLPYNAFSIVSTPRISERIENKRINIDFCYGYDDPERYKAECSINGRTFPYYVLVSEEYQEELIGEHDNYNIRRFRPSTEYALGACFPKRVHGFPPTQGAVLVEFDKRITHIDEPSHILQEMAELYGQIKQASEKFKEWGDLVHVASSLPGLDFIQNDNLTATDFLDRMAEELSSTLNAERCIFFEISNEEQTPVLKTVASFPRVGNGSNILWSTEVNRLFVEKIQVELRQREDFVDCITIEVPGIEGFTSYTVFATRLRARLNDREFLFVSLENAKTDKPSRPIISKVVRNVLSFELQSISSILEKKQYTGSTRALKNSMQTAIQLLFNEVDAKTDTFEKTEEAIFDKVHSLLKRWTSIIGTPYAAIYKFDKSKNKLVMTQSTYKSIKEEYKNLNSKVKFPEEPLVIDVNPKSQLSDKGLTYSIWTGRNRSLISINVGEQGSRQCIEWWDNAVGANARGRYFAGAKIIDTKQSISYGVLTINGNKPANFIARELEAEWEVLPLLEVLSEELGNYLSKLYSKHSRHS